MFSVPCLVDARRVVILLKALSGWKIHIVGIKAIDKREQAITHRHNINRSLMIWLFHKIDHYILVSWYDYKQWKNNATLDIYGLISSSDWDIYDYLELKNIYKVFELSIEKLV